MKLNDMIDMEHTKFLVRFNNNVLSYYFKNYFVKLETIHHYHTRQKTKTKFFSRFCSSRMGGGDKDDLT